MIEYISPTKIKLIGYDNKINDLRKSLTFTDKTITQAIKRHKNAHWFINKYGSELYYEKLEELRNQEKVCLLEEKEDLITYSRFN